MDKTIKNIAVLSRMWPKQCNQLSGIFIYNSIKEFIGLGYKVNVICPISIITFLKNRFNIRNDCFHNIKNLNVFYIPYLPITAIKFPQTLSLSVTFSVLIFNAHYKFLNNANILFSNFIFFEGYVGNILSRLKKLKHFNIMRGDDVNIWPQKSIAIKKISNKSFLKFDKSFAVSKSLSKEAKNVFPFMDKIKIEPFYTFCKEAKSVKPCPNNITKLYFIGSLNKNKGITELIAAYKKLKEIFSFLTLTIVGNGIFRQQIELMCKNDKNVFYHPKIDHKNIWKIHYDNDLLVFPSYNEGLANTIVEALSYGNFVAASAIESNKEILSGITSLYAVKNINGIVDTCVNIIKSDMKWKLTYQKNARFTWKQKFSPAEHRKQIKRFF